MTKASTILFNIVTCGLHHVRQVEDHRHAVMSKEESVLYIQWQDSQIIAPRIGASHIPCPLDLVEIDARAKAAGMRLAQ